MGNWSRILGASRGDRWPRKAGAPQFLTERQQQIGEGDGGLGGIPWAHDPAEGATLLEVRGGPEQDQAVDHSGERGGPFNRPWRLVLGVAEAEVLFAVMEGDLQRPAMGIRLEDGRRVLRQIGAEERLVMASATRVAHHHDPDEL